MERLSSEIKSNRHEPTNALDFKSVKKVLETQPYPAGAVKYLKMISENYNWRWSMIRAYQLGVIVGRQHGRSRARIGNKSKKTLAKH